MHQAIILLIAVLSAGGTAYNTNVSSGSSYAFKENGVVKATIEAGGLYCPAAVATVALPASCKDGSIVWDSTAAKLKYCAGNTWYLAGTGAAAATAAALASTPAGCTNQFARGISATGAATCASVNLSTDTAATALPVTKGGTGLTSLTAGGILATGTNTVVNTFGAQAQAWMGSTTGGTGSFQDTFLRLFRNTNWTNSTTTPTAIFTLNVGQSGYHHVECTLPVMCVADSCPQIKVGGGSWDSSGYFTLRSHRTAATPNWDHMAIDGLSTACTSGCYTSFANWHLEGSFYTADADTVYVYGQASQANQAAVTVYAGATCKWN